MPITYRETSDFIHQKARTFPNPKEPQKPLEVIHMINLMDINGMIMSRIIIDFDCLEVDIHVVGKPSYTCSI